ncbi:hypothetical protein IQ07DRAFT_591423 [Pyrenochaeta sp. DS3sAY3a]|nr:hypothetical protein IQ07DRAFT_591423 [Pyrenochaeta sp. DS3sAY3a]
MNAGIRSALSSIWAAVHSPSGLPFPETVSQLVALGITRYRVDYIARNITAYQPASPGAALPTSGSRTEGALFDTVAFPAEHEYTLGSWNKDGVVAAIRRAQAGEGNYVGFSERIVGSGVVEYTVYIDGKKVVYVGSEGDVHTEWFPGAGPNSDK